MNKYFLGFTLPADPCFKLRLTKAQTLFGDTLKPTTRVLPPEEFHVTSLFLGKCPRSAAEDLCNNLTWGFGSIALRYDHVAVFENGKGPHALVLKLDDLYGNAAMMHRDLRQAALRNPLISIHKFAAYSYNPHITLAKCDGTTDPALTVAADAINEKMVHNVTRHEFYCDHLVLFEKVEGSDTYEPHRMLQLR